MSAPRQFDPRRARQLMERWMGSEMKTLATLGNLVVLLDVLLDTRPSPEPAPVKRGATPCPECGSYSCLGDELLCEKYKRDRAADLYQGAG